MDLHDLSSVLTAEGPFVTVLVDSESEVEQAADKYDLQWKNVLKELADRGVDERTREAVAAARGDHAEGAARLVVASTRDATVRLAASLSTPQPRPIVDVAPLPRLRPLVEELSQRVPHVVVLADRTGAEVSAWYDSQHLAEQLTVQGTDFHIRKVHSGGWAHLHYLHSAENNWAANAKQIVARVVDLARQVDARLIVMAGDERELGYLRENLPTALQPKVVEVPGGRGHDGSEELVRRRVADAVALHVARNTLDLLGSYAQERGQDKRACDGLEDVVQALRKAQVQTLLITTQTEPDRTLLYGPEPTQLGTSAADLAALGVEQPQEAPAVDVLIRAAVATSADVQLVPGEMPEAPRDGVGAVLRYADGLGSHAAAQ